MENILKEIAQIDTEKEDLHKLELLNETISQVSQNVKKQNDEHLKNITSIFAEKIKNNPGYNKVVTDFVNKYVNDDKKEDATNELFLILTGELLSVFKGLNQTNCSIM